MVATPRGAPEFAINATGTVLVRPQAVSIDNVSVSPAYGPAGTHFVVTARVFAAVNEPTQVFLRTQLLKPNGQLGNLYQSDAVNLTTTAGLQTVTIANVDSTNFADGAYVIPVTAIYPTGALIQGAAATGAFLVGAPIAAS